MKIQVFSQYYNLAQAGRVKPLACPNHKSEEASYNLIHKLDNNDNIVLHCLSCGYSQTAGIQLYENILSEIRKLDNA
jgi:DNA-directed RNA polymerase subunit M/transcription elongation factor TFIIS